MTISNHNSDSTALRLLKTRELAGLTQAELASKSGVSTSTIGNLEAGIRGYGKSAIYIAQALNVSTEYLLHGSETPTPGPASATLPSKLTPQALELAALFDLLRDRVERATAYNIASAAILDVLKKK